MKYKIARNGQEIGEWTLEEVRAKYQLGELTATDMAWTPGMDNWMLLPQVLGMVQPGVSPAPLGAATLAQGVPDTKPDKPASNLVWAILVTIFCCWPLGIPSIVFAAQVDSAYVSGDYARALELAKKSKKWMWAAIGAGLLFGIIYGILLVLGAIPQV